MWPEDNEERIWATLTHLKLQPTSFLEKLADTVPEASDRFAWLVRCNPLLQIRSVILDFEVDWHESNEYASLLALLAKYDKQITPTGSLDCGIYTKRSFLRQDVWREIRGMAERILAQCGLPDWELPDQWSYQKFATWDEAEDELFSIIRRGGDTRSLPWIRSHASSLWEPRK